ncbi:MAG: hypothetical protein JO187_12240 [Acidobacteria bacterium]|nr:hypothetical protein [Acidobacteriaceae bacterium]MBV9610319.1 hypothetical protein [Acidobacteriota bacterium]
MNRTIKTLAAVAFAMLFTCAALATDTLVMRDGSSHTGTFVSATATYITFREGRTLHRYPRSRVQSLDFGTGTLGAAPVGPGASVLGANQGTALPGRNPVTLPSGTEIEVLTNQAIDSKNANEGQSFSADVSQNVLNSAGQVVIPRGSPAELVIRRVSAGNITGGSEITLDLQSVKVGGHRYLVNTQDLQQQGTQGIGANKRTAEMVGGGTALGTLIGAVAGGGKGAAIGAITGAAAGAGTQILTRGKTVEVPAESKLRFRLDQPLTLSPAY